MDSLILKELIREQKVRFLSLEPSVKRDILPDIKKHIKLPHSVILGGLRRCGKSTFLSQIRNGYYGENCYYFNFEDERLLNFTPDDFNILYELLVEMSGSHKTFFLDEIQNVSGWENFVRRMQEDQFKFFITGSNASLLSKEFGTKLTGRHISLRLYPFSFHEFLKYKKVEVHHHSLNASSRGTLKSYFNQYVENGGMPEYLKYDNEEILKQVYDDVLYRDIAVRYKLNEIKSLRETALFLISNISNKISYNNIKNILKLGSVNTVIKYAEYLENSFLFFPVNVFSYSLKQQLIAPKKIYCVDNGFVNHVAFKFSDDKGRFLENSVFMELKRRNKEIFYYNTANHLEVDFFVREKGKRDELIQVSRSIDNAKTKARELKSMETALSETGIKEGLLLTYDKSGSVKTPSGKITIMPVYQWMLGM